MTNPFDALPRTPANHAPLTPLTFLERAATVFPDRTAIVHDGPAAELRVDYRAFYARARRLASALAARGIGANDVVAALLFNTPPMLEAHYGAPMTRGVLNALNTRLDAAAIAFILEHGGAKVVIVDTHLAALLEAALAKMTKPRPDVIIYRDPTIADHPETGLHGVDYEAFLEGGDPAYAWAGPVDEWDAVSLNYTSGTTADPKGVVYHHRGAALLATGNITHAAQGRHPVYLWTLPMFHCNGWCFPWSISIVAGTHVCLRAVRADAIYERIAKHGVTLLCGAPIVMSTLLQAREEEKRAFPQTVDFWTAAAPPPAAVLQAMDEAGFNVIHVYGLTEVYGPAVICEPQADWAALDPQTRAQKTSRQGVRYAALDGLAVMDPETMTPTPADGETLGEVMMRGNVVMKGYLKNDAANAAAFADGWFHTGDLGVMHADGYVQLKDRSKDIIISGGENISSIEVEDVLFQHPAVALAAVVAQPDPRWGETPCAFVELKPGAGLTEAEAIAWCRERLAHFKAPRRVVFGELPKTSTGKIQKFKLRDRVRAEA